VPLLFVIAQSGKYLNPAIDPDQIIPWMKQYIVNAFSTSLCCSVTLDVPNYFTLKSFPVDSDLVFILM
jgi:hypothetical protein